MAKKNDSRTLFSRLTKLFRSGPVVKKKIRSIDTVAAVPDRTKSSGALLFSKSITPTYSNITGNAYNIAERMMRYQDFQEMEQTPELSSALDIYAEEICAQNDKGRILHIHSNNEKIQEVLEELFYDIINIEFNFKPWVRNACKFGDTFLLNDVHPVDGIINVIPIPVNEIEREENFDPQDPFGVRFRWATMGNRTLENWEVTHFRLLSNDTFLPYGSSVLEGARRIWRQLILIEDAMLVYRITRAPERRVFYIDVGNLAPEDVANYVEEQRARMRTNQVVDRATGRVDLRYNGMSVDEDYLLPVRGGDSGTKIDTLAGGQNTAAIEDVAYIQKKLFAALKIPRAYLGYDEMLGSKSTLSQEDIRFSRTINSIQKMFLSELNKIAIIHLYAKGFTSSDLQNFVLRLSNPSTVAQQQKLELWRTKFEIAASMPENMGSQEFIQRNIWDLNSEEIESIKRQRLQEKLTDASIEAAVGGGEELSGGDEGLFGGGETEPVAEPAEETPPPENAEDEPEELDEPGVELLTSSDYDDSDDINLRFELDKAPIKPNSHIKKVLYNRSRKRTHGASKTHMPDHYKMTSSDKSFSDPYDQASAKSVVTNPLVDGFMRREKDEFLYEKTRVTQDIQASLNKMNKHFANKKVLTENAEKQYFDVSEELDIISDDED